MCVADALFEVVVVKIGANMGALIFYCCERQVAEGAGGGGVCGGVCGVAYALEGSFVVLIVLFFIRRDIRDVLFWLQRGEDVFRDVVR